MKRLFFAVVLVATFVLALASCKNKNDEQCWKVEATEIITMGEESDTIVTVFYVWCTEDEIDATIKSSSIGISMGGGMGGTITYKTIAADNYKTQKDCMANSPQVNM